MRALRGVSRRLSTPALKPPSAHALGWRVTPVAHALGAEIEGADLSHIGATEFAAVREALLQYEVIFFRDQASFDPALSPPSLPSAFSWVASQATRVPAHGRAR